jgi:glutathione peroxidase
MNTVPLSMYSYRFVHVLAAFVVLAALAVTGARSAQASECPALLRHSFPDLRTGEPQDLCQYRGRVILVVNTASYCGLHRPVRRPGGPVPQVPRPWSWWSWLSLQRLRRPGNPASNSQIANFCRLTYGVQFPMFAKSRVVGDRRNALFGELARRTGETPRWNFHKYLIDRDGTRVLSFGSAVSPEDSRLKQSLFQLLDARKSLKRET